MLMSPACFACLILGGARVPGTGTCLYFTLRWEKTLPFSYTSTQPDCIRETLGSAANRLQHLPILAFNRQLKPQARQPQQGTMST